ncbi:DUF3281 family protein [Francisella sciaenopsi]|uniref:Uncharacterized protein n=1 Tax=Francisella sciaenopsi TaxID=3055034 RepID=A0ABQ6PED9_9GAMM
MVQWNQTPSFTVSDTILEARWNAEIVDGAGETLYYDIYLVKPGTFEAVYSSLDQTSSGMTLDLTAIPGFESGTYIVQVVAHGIGATSVTIERSIEQSAPQDIVMPSTVSHTFIYNDAYPLPEGQTMTNVADALNVNKASANGTFGVDQNNNLTIICDDSWIWPVDFDPAWGEVHIYNPGFESIDMAQINWNGTIWVTNAFNSYYTNVNASDSFSFEFDIGCFPA